MDEPPIFSRLLYRGGGGGGGGDEDGDGEFRKPRLVTRSGMKIPITLTEPHLFISHF